MRRILPFAIIGLVLIGAAAAGYYFFRSASEPPATAANTRPAASGANTAASPAAHVTIEEFADFQCPSCAVFAPTMKRIKEEYGDRIVLNFYQFPLMQIHRHALAAAWATEAAGMQDKFWEMHDRIFETQSQWSQAVDVRPIFEGFARDLGLDVPRFTRDMYSGHVNRLVQQDMALGHQLGVTSTPSVFVDGRLVQSSERTPEGLRRLIDAALAANAN